MIASLLQSLGLRHITSLTNPSHWYLFKGYAIKVILNDV